MIGMSFSMSRLDNCYVIWEVWLELVSRDLWKCSTLSSYVKMMTLCEIVHLALAMTHGAQWRTTSPIKAHRL